MAAARPAAAVRSFSYHHQLFVVLWVVCTVAAAASFPAGGYSGWPLTAVLCCAVLQVVEIVLTAHPTQVNRRTLQYKHSKIATLLQQHDR